MEKIKNTKKLMLFLGITLFIQAVTSLVGGSIFMGPFSDNVINASTLSGISNNAIIAYLSIIIQMITGIVIIFLAAAMYKAAGHHNKTLAISALYFYLLEVVLIEFGQVMIFAIVQVSQMYVDTGNIGLIPIGETLLIMKEFAGKFAMIPFGLGAVIFYYLLMKQEILPKWLALWGIITAPLILIFTPMMAFGVNVPFALLVPYVPFEFFAGIFVIIKYSKTNSLSQA